MSLITGPLLARIAVTATSGGASFARAIQDLSLRPAANIRLVVAHGYNADLEFSTGGSAPKVPVPDDTSAPDNYIFYDGAVASAPTTAYAATNTAIEVLVYQLRA